MRMTLDLLAIVQRKLRYSARRDEMMLKRHVTKCWHHCYLRDAKPAVIMEAIEIIMLNTLGVAS